MRQRKREREEEEEKSDIDLDLIFCGYETDEDRKSKERKLHYIDKYLTEMERSKEQDNYHSIMFSSYGPNNGKINMVYFPFEKGQQLEVDFMPDSNNKWHYSTDDVTIASYLFKEEHMENLEDLKMALGVLYKVKGTIGEENEMCKKARQIIAGLDYRESWIGEMQLIDIFDKK